MPSVTPTLHHRRATGQLFPRQATRLSTTKRACDHCRRRKIKCDSTSTPCSNCMVAELACSYEILPRKRGPRFRVAPTQSIIESHSNSLSSDTHLEKSDSTTPPPRSEELFSPTLSSGHTTRTDIATSGRCWHPEHAQNPPNQTLKPNLLSELLGIHDELVSKVHAALPDCSIQALVAKCIDLFLHYLFPIMPIVHEQTLRNSSFIFDANATWLHTPQTRHQWPAGAGKLLGEDDTLSAARQFALVTAICAEVSFLLSSKLFLQGALLADHFLQASRDTLSLYHDTDIEAPNSSSLVIRFLHSTCTHAAGKRKVSWHLLGEAIRMSQEMRLYTEASLEKLDPVESQLRRNIFWQLYASDKSACLLNGTPFALHEINLGTKISILRKAPGGYSLLDRSRPHNTELFESRLMEGFQLNWTLWSLASNLILDLQLLQPVSACTDHSPTPPSEEQKSTAMNAYLRFTSLICDMPSWLRALNLSKMPVTDDERYQSSGFWIQRTNLEVTFQSLCLIVLQRSYSLGFSSLVGISSEPLMIALKKIEIAHQMLSVVQAVPFESLQINGECCVEKLRQVGASLLEVTQTISNDQITGRAQLTFSALLDIIANLDSRASISSTYCA